MIGADYFRTDIHDQINELGAGAARVEIHLYDGSVYSVRTLGKTDNSYVLLEVYPVEGVNDASEAARRKPGGTDEVFFDRVAIPYEAIAQVLLTVKDVERRPAIGFRRT
jgi:hypothetical protein